MSTPAPHGAPLNRTQSRESGPETHASQSEACPDFRGIADQLRDRGHHVGPSSVRRMYRFWQAQARAEVGFRDWILTYLDPTGEHATDNVLRQYAKELAS